MLGFAPAQGQGQHPVTGRQIAGVMGVQGAGWLNRPEREKEENPEGALDALKIRPGMVVADVGAGTGYMSLRLAKRVGPAGKVYANDLQPEMLREQTRLRNVFLSQIDAACESCATGHNIERERAVIARQIEHSLAAEIATV